MEAHLRAGIAIFNAGGYHGSHDAWEACWLEQDPDTPDERFLHGLIQYAAAVFHARNRNWSGATGLAESGSGYLADLPGTYRSVNVEEVRTYLDDLRRDPELIERRPPLPLRHRGERVMPEDLGFDATCIAAEVLAEERQHHRESSHTSRDESELIEWAIRYARADREETGSPFPSLLFDYVRNPEHRDVVVQRLGEHADRRSAVESDVSGLFDPEDGAGSEE